MKIVISGGRVFDPINGVCGEEKDLYIEDGFVVEKISGSPDLVIKADKRVIMAGAIEVSSFIFSIFSNLFLPDLTNYINVYKKLGFTHINEIFCPLHTSYFTHLYMDRFSIFDVSKFILISLKGFDLLIKREKGRKDLSFLLSNLLYSTKSCGLFFYELSLFHKKEEYQFRNLEKSEVLGFLNDFCGDLPISIRGDMELDFESLKKEIKVIFFDDIQRAPRFNFFSIMPGISSVKIGSGGPFFDLGFTEPFGISKGVAEVYHKNISILKNSDNVCLSVGLPFGDPKVFSKVLDELDPLTIAKVTRKNPAKFLGIDRYSGHLGEGALANISIYKRDKGKLELELLIKGGIPLGKSQNAPKRFIFYKGEKKEFEKSLLERIFSFSSSYFNFTTSFSEILC